MRTRKRWYGGALALAWVVATCGCSAVVDPDIGRLGGPPPPTCKPQSVVDCACNGGIGGKQICNSGGTFNPCVCGSAGTGG